MAERKPDFYSIMRSLQALKTSKGRDNISRFGLTGGKMFGVTVTDLRKLAKQIGKNHGLALQLWRSGVHEARLLAGMVEETDKVSEEQADSWLKDFDSWDLVDETCLNVFCKMPNPFRRARKWAQREGEFEKRAAFSLIACLAWYSKNDVADQEFVDFLPQIKKASTDERNFVKKAVNWALRQIGKRNRKLNAKALQAAREISEIDSPAAKWISSNALKELESEEVQKRFS